ncbi:MAG: hypothetical protein JSV88_15600, partial [Candidatus Aminicenantes bacterium]
MNKMFHSQPKSPFSFSKLKFLLLGLLVVLLLGSSPVSHHLASGNEQGNFKSTLPHLTIKDLKISGVDVGFKFNGTVFSHQDVEGTRYSIPHIYGFAHMREVGSPMLPAKNLHIAVPHGANPAIEIVDSHFKEHSEPCTIHPSLAPQPDCRDCPKPEFEINRDVYETDADFPGKLVEVINTDTYMGVPIAVIQVRPLQFNPVTQKLKVYSRIKFKVTFTGAERSFEPFASNSEHANQMVRSAVLNRDAIPRGVDRNKNFSESSRNGRKDYIMIVHSDFLTEAQELAMWKRQLGYSVEIVSQSSWTTTQVKNELQTRYDSWTPKPLFFLIFGDQEYVPAEYTTRYTDLYYAE